MKPETLAERPGMSTLDSKVRSAAHRLMEAATTGRPCHPVRNILSPEDAVAAYQVQRHVLDHRLEQGARVVGRKIGITSPAVQTQLNVDSPDYGFLLDDMQFEDDAVLPMTNLLQPRVEAEIAFWLTRDLVGGPFTSADVVTAVGVASAALEIVDSRIEAWDITFVDTVADNASSGLFVLGRERLDLSRFVPKDVAMTLWANGSEVSRGTGRDCLGDPLNAVAWLANVADSVGDPLRAGQIVMSGALGPMVTAEPGMAITAEVSGLGSVSATFASHSQDLAQ